MRRGHRVSVAKERPDRNVGGEGRLRGRDGGACSECYVNNFHPRGCNRPYERGKGREGRQERRKRKSEWRREGKTAMAPVRPVRGAATTVVRSAPEVDLKYS